ncbi:MAG TPA: NUDIX domain-containing protein [Hyphomicrobiaceae bacterium]|nr:NUDIX domain-containing protein [Hyphomicrobiaceae bacterium]
MTTDARSDNPRKVLRPRDAATLIIVDMATGEPRVLLGRRRPDLVFMPGRYVFPGGRVDPADRQIPVEQDLAPGNLENLMRDVKGNFSPARARALALAAVRETYEEAGLLIGTPTGAAALPKAEAWQKFFAHGFRPALAQLTFFARAVTPPGRPRRYDTRFFCVAAEAIAHRTGSADGELSDLEWHSLEQARALDLPNITRVVLEDLGERIAAGALQKCDVPVPFYHRRNGNFHRDLIRPDTRLDSSGPLDRVRSHSTF